MFLKEPIQHCCITLYRLIELDKSRITVFGLKLNSILLLVIIFLLSASLAVFLITGYYQLPQAVSSYDVTSSIRMTNHHMIMYHHSAFL